MKRLLDFASTTQMILCERGAISHLPEALRRYLSKAMKSSLFIITDDHTWEAAGERTVDLLRSELPEIDLILETLPGTPILSADYTHVRNLVERLRSYPGIFPLVIGSGTLNDLVKRAAFEVGTPYAVVATAVSVDGYLSHGAALLEHGYKHTFTCDAPVIVVGDLDILEAAPRSMTSAGYADLAAKIPAGADWILARALQEDTLDQETWDLVQPTLRETLSDPRDLERIFLLLAASGIAMQYSGVSRPASGAEHLIAHIWEMRHHTYQGIPVSHGYHVGLGSLVSIAAMEVLSTITITAADVDHALSERQPLSHRERRVTTLFHPGAESDAVIQTLRAKYPTEERLKRRLQNYLDHQTEVMQAMTRQNLPYEQFRELLRGAGCPVTPEETGLTRESFIQSMVPAQYLRDRYTILDLLDDLGKMEEVIARIMRSEIYLK